MFLLLLGRIGDLLLSIVEVKHTTLARSETNEHSVASLNINASDFVFLLPFVGLFAFFARFGGVLALSIDYNRVKLEQQHWFI